MKLDAEALYSLVIQEPGLRVAERTPGQHVIDAFCGAGGSAIAFARAGKQVTAIELDATRLECARFNAELFGVADRIHFLCADSLTLLPVLEADTIYLAPPWGGPQYANKPLFSLDCFSPNGKDLLDISLRPGRNVLMQVPRNFDLDELKAFGRSFELHEDRLGDELLSYTLFFGIRTAE